MGESESSLRVDRRLSISRKCVLIIEDNALNMKLFSAMVEAQGYDVIQVMDGAQGLEVASSVHPDLIIMDIQLPSMSGLEVTRALKADVTTYNIPIIATTAFAIRGDEKKILASGCDAYMAKPIAISPFLDLVEGLMGRASGVEAPPTVAAGAAGPALP